MSSFAPSVRAGWATLYDAEYLMQAAFSMVGKVFALWILPTGRTSPLPFDAANPQGCAAGLADPYLMPVDVSVAGSTFQTGPRLGNTASPHYSHIRPTLSRLEGYLAPPG